MFDDGEIEEICSALQDVAIAFGVSEKSYQSEDPTILTFLEALHVVRGKVLVAVGPLV